MTRLWRVNDNFVTSRLDHGRIRCQRGEHLFKYYSDATEIVFGVIIMDRGSNNCTNGACGEGDANGGIAWSATSIVECAWRIEIGYRLQEVWTTLDMRGGVRGGTNPEGTDKVHCHDKTRLGSLKLLRA